MRGNWMAGSLAAVCAVTQIAWAADARLADAAKRQDRAAVIALVNRGTDTNAAQPDGATALHWAAHWDDIEMATALLKAGAHANAANDNGITPLALACTNGSVAMTTALLKGGADPSLARMTGETPLMTAAAAGSAEVVKLLLAAGAKVNAAEPEHQQNALMWALAGHHLPVAQLLIENGANIHARTKVVPGKPSPYGMGLSGAQGSFTPLMFAVRWGNLDAVKMLLAKGAKLEDADAGGMSVLMIAALRGHAKLAVYLLDQGADPNVDKAGYTALHWAVGKWESDQTHDYPDAPESEWRYLIGVPDGKIELINALIAHGANVNAKMSKNPPRYGIDLFHMVRLTGATPFWIAALSADVEVMRLLVAKGADPNVNNADNVTPLMVAAGIGRASGESLISDEQALAAAKVCLELGNDVNAANGAGDTALHGTAQYGNEKTAAFLVEHGASLTAKNKKGETALAVAEAYQVNAMVVRHPNVAALLKKFGASSQ
jgi:ankyrin repeat protein